MTLSSMTFAGKKLFLKLQLKFLYSYNVPASEAAKYFGMDKRSVAYHYRNFSKDGIKKASVEKILEQFDPKSEVEALLNQEYTRKKD